MQRDDPRPVLYVAVLGSHPGALDVDVHGTMTQCGPAWEGEEVLTHHLESPIHLTDMSTCGGMTPKHPQRTHTDMETILLLAPRPHRDY